VVAEGIESARVWGLLKDRHCDMAQGYFIAKPLALTDLVAWLGANKGVFCALSRHERRRGLRLVAASARHQTPRQFIADIS